MSVMQVSKNELTTALQKAAVGQGFDQGTGQWLAAAVVRARATGHPGLTWGLGALAAKPEPARVDQRADGWVCRNHAVLIAGPILTDLLKAGQSLATEDVAKSTAEDVTEPLAGPGFASLDVPDLWTHWRDSHPIPAPGPLEITRDQWNALQTIAAKTYVPATAESRQRGAG